MFTFLRSTRFWLAGPVALLLSILFMASMSLWLPKGAAGINHLVLPIILFPLIWSVFFFYAVMADNKKRMVLVMLSLLLLCGGLVTASFMGMLTI